MAVPRIQPPSTGETVAAERPGTEPQQQELFSGEPGKAPDSVNAEPARSEPKPKDRSRLPTMVDPQEAIGKARKAVTERAELPGMSLMEHLDELRKRIVHSAIYLAVGFVVAWVFHDRLVRFHSGPARHSSASSSSSPTPWTR